MRLFIAELELNSSLQRVGQVDGSPREQPAFMVRGGRCQYPIAAFDAHLAEVKARRHFPGLIHALTVHEVHGNAFPRRYWDEQQRKFIYPKPGFHGGTVQHPDNPAQLRMRIVHDRLTADMSADKAWAAGWKAATADFGPRKRLDTNLAKAIAKHNPEDAARFTAGYTRSWDRRKASKTAAMFKDFGKKVRSVKKKTTAA